MFGAVLFGLFGLSFLLSKSGFTAFYALVLIYSLFKFDWKNIKQRSFLEKWLMLLFPMAIIFNFFSIAGPEAAWMVVTRWTWPLVYFPVVYLTEHAPARKLFLKGLAISLFMSCLFSLCIFAFHYEFAYDAKMRLASFWDILRWGYFCAIAVIILFSIMIKPKFLNKISWSVCLVLFLMSVMALILNNSRGAWIGTASGILVVLLMQRKSFWHFLGYISVVAVLVFSSDVIRNNVLSSFAVKKVGDQITSTNGSNATRLAIWKVAADLYVKVPFFGVGFENSEVALREFLSQQDPTYIKKYVADEYSYSDQHSSYFSILLQFGGIYFVFLYLPVLLVLWRGRNNSLYTPPLICTGIVYFFYSGIVSFEAIVFFGLISFLVLETKE